MLYFAVAGGLLFTLAAAATFTAARLVGSWYACQDEEDKVQ